MQKQKLDPQQALMKAMNCTDEDLSANRDGYMTLRQKNRLKRRRTSLILYIFGGLAIGSLQLTIFGYLFSDVIIIVLLIGTFTILYTVLGFLERRRFSLDLHKGAVEVIEGRITLDVVTGRGAYYAVSIGKIKFRINRRVFLAFKNGDPYCLYFAPHAKVLLSADWLQQVSDFQRRGGLNCSKLSVP